MSITVPIENLRILNLAMANPVLSGCSGHPFDNRCPNIKVATDGPLRLMAG